MKYSRQQIQEMAQRAIQASNSEALSDSYINWQTLIAVLANEFRLTRRAVAQRINLLAMDIGF